jgi:hypothetical protein
VLAAVPDLAANWAGCTRATVTQLMFALYGAFGIISLLLYQPLSPAVETSLRFQALRPVAQPRLSDGRPVWHGFIRHRLSVQPLLALWLYQTFAISVTMPPDPVLE